jgi:hypothetical protein
MNASNGEITSTTRSELPIGGRRARHDRVVEQLEFWPDCGGGPLWAPDGAPVDVASLPLPEDLRSRVRTWNARYEEARLPFEGNDVAWLAEGKVLLAELRHALSDRLIVVTEPWWGKEPNA